MLVAIEKDITSSFSSRFLNEGKANETDKQ